jgi:hypothetical protein
VFCSGSRASSRAEAGSPRSVGADQLVDLVEDDHGVDGAGALHRLDEAAGQGADVRAAVAADLGVVAHAAERDADVLAAEGLGDAAAERGLADAGRADEAEDRAALVGRELADAEVLEDALLDPLEAVVVGLEQLAGGGEVELVRGGRARAPREVGDPLEVGAGDRRLAALRVHAAQAAELAGGGGAGLGRQVEGGEALLELREAALVGLAVGLAELGLDGAQLVAQEGVVLVLRQVLADVAVEVALDLEDVGAVRRELDDLRPGMPWRTCVISASTATGCRSSSEGRGPPPSRCRAMMTRFVVGSRRALS